MLARENPSPFMVPSANACVVPTAAGSRTGARRTDLQNRGQATSRPREAPEESGTQSPYSPNRAGGVQRGWQSTEGTLTPPLALFASFSGARKKGLHKRKQAQKKRQPLHCPFRACVNVQLWSAPLRLRGLFLESGDSRKARAVCACGHGGLRRGGASAAPPPPQGALAP